MASSLHSHRSDPGRRGAGSLRGQPNERWQADTTHWQLADGTGVEILNLLDDHSRLALASLPRRTITGPDVAHTFKDAFAHCAIPASVLTGNGAVLTGKQRGGGRVALEVDLGRLESPRIRLSTRPSRRHMRPILMALLATLEGQVAEWHETSPSSVGGRPNPRARR